MTDASPPVKELATVETTVPTTHFPGPNGGFGRTTVTVPLAPAPNRITERHGMGGNELEITYTDGADAQAIVAASESASEAYFSVPGIPDVVRISGQRSSADGSATVFTAVEVGTTLGDLTQQRAHDATNRKAHDASIRRQNAEVDARAADPDRSARLTAIDAAYDALNRRDQIQFLASKVDRLEGPDRFTVTNPAAVGLT